ncbi:unnamed protein product [Pylaiella littoralis]
MNRSSNSRGRVINTDHSPCTMRSPGLLKEDLAGLNRRIQTVLNKKGAGIKDGLTAQNCARLVRHAQKSADPLAGEKANPIPPVSRVGRIMSYRKASVHTNESALFFPAFEGGLSYRCASC